MNRLIKTIVRFGCRAWLVCGLCCLAVGLGFGVYNAIFLIRAVSAKGTIVGLNPVTNQEDGALNYAPVFKFIAEDGRTYTVTASFATNPPSFTVGQDIRVLYIKTNPAGAKLGYFWQLWFVAILCAGLGIFFVQQDICSCVMNEGCNSARCLRPKNGRSCRFRKRGHRHFYQRLTLALFSRSRTRYLWKCATRK